MRFYGGSGGNFYNVTDQVGYLGDFHLFAGAGNDSVAVNNLEVYPYWNHALNIHGQGGFDTLTVDDTSATRDATYAFAASSLTRTSRAPSLPWDSVVAVRHDEIETLGLRAGAGIDTLDYSGWAANLFVNLQAGQATGFAGGLAGVENVTAAEGNDYLIGDGRPNVLRGKGGHDVVIGGAGNDSLFGGAGRDLLIGGLGVDALESGPDDDVVIGGYTLFDTQVAAGGLVSHAIDYQALNAVMREWTRTDAAYQDRVRHLRSGEGGLNGLTALTNARGRRTVFDDDAADSLAGGEGLDWFFVADGQDLLTDPLELRDKKETHTKAR